MLPDPAPSTSQRPLADLPAPRWDAVVVGAGPSGAAAAWALAREGAAVLLLDGQAFPRDKTCGDALIPDAQAALARMGLLDDVRALAWRAPGGDAFSPSGVRVPVDCEILTVPRRVLDARLAMAAVAAGATFAHGRVEAVDDAGLDGGVTVRLADGARVSARTAVLAPGARATLLESVGLLERRRGSAVAYRGYLTSPVREDRLLVSFDRAVLPGYAWCFPVADSAAGRTYNVGVGLVLDGDDAEEAAAGRRLRPTLERYLHDTPVVRELAAAGGALVAPRGALIRNGLTGARPWRGGAAIAVGEAVGATFPLTGEGIGKALSTGLLGGAALAAALRAPDASAARAALAAYPEALDRELRPLYRGYAFAERWMAHPWLAELVFRRAARRAPLRAAFAGILRESVDPARVFSPVGVVRALLA